MATEAATIEAARTRIQRLVEQIAALGKAEISSEDFFAKFLDRVTGATDAKGGALWLVGSRPQDDKRHFQLCAQIDLPSSLFDSNEAQRAALLRILTEVIRANKPLILNPAPVETAPPVDSTPPTAPLNQTPYPFLHLPLHLGSQAIGVLQIWLQPGVQPRSFPEFVTFLTSLTPTVEQHLQSRRPANLLLENQRLGQFLRFSADLAASTALPRIAGLTADYARDLAGCERASFLLKEGDSWKLLAISGRQTVQPDDPISGAITAFVHTHFAAETRILDKRELLERADQPALLYFHHSNLHSGVICPILDAEKEVAGAILCESAFEGYFDSAGGNSEVLPPRRVVEWVAGHAGRAVAAARDSQALPLVQWVRERQLLLSGKEGTRILLKPALFAAILLLILLYPARRHVDGPCSIQALHRAIVASEISARIDTVLVREGDHVTKGQELARLDPTRLKPPGDAGSATLRSPIDGVVMTRELELRAGGILEEGAPFAEIDDLASWQLHTQVNERDIAAVEDSIREKGSLDLTYTLESQSARLHARLDSLRQISPSASPRGRENVFLITIDGPPIPADIAKDLHPGLTGRAELELGRRPFLFTIVRELYRIF